MTGPRLEDLLNRNPQTPQQASGPLKLDDLLSDSTNESAGEDPNAVHPLKQVRLFLESMGHTLAGPIQVVSEVLEAPFKQPISDETIRQNREFALDIARMDDTSPETRQQALQLAARLGGELETRQRARTFQRAEAARARAGMQTREQIRDAARHLAYETPGPQPELLSKEPLPGQEPSQTEQLLTGLHPALILPQLIEAYDQAVTPEDYARATGNAAAIVLMVGHGEISTARSMRGQLAERFVRRQVDARLRADAMAEARQRVLGEMVHEAPAPPSKVIPGIQRLANVEEQLAIRNRLLEEEAGDVTAAIIRAHNELKPFSTTIIPGVARIGEAYRRAKKINPELRLVNHRRADGLLDVAVYGDRSPLMDESLRDQFEAQGYFDGQEVFYNGKPVVYRDRMKLASGEEFALVSDPSSPQAASGASEHIPYADFVPFADIRRPAYTEVGVPFVVEQRVTERQINARMSERVVSTQMRVRVGEDVVSAKALGDDFENYALRILMDPAEAAKLVGIDLTGTRVRNERGVVKRMYHGSTRSFDEFSMEFADPYALAGPGFYFTDSYHVSGEGYAVPYRQGALDEVFDSYEAALLYSDSRTREGYATIIKKVDRKTTLTGFVPESFRVEVHELSNVRPAYLNIRNPYDWETPVDPRFVEYVRSKIKQGIKGVPREDSALAIQSLNLLDDFLTDSPYATGGMFQEVVNANILGHIDFGPKETFFGQWQREFGYDGVRYDGGKRIPMRDADGKPILHEVWVAFDPSQIISPWVSGSATFERVAEQFAKDRGYGPEQVHGIRRFLEQQMGKRERELYLTPDEKEMYNKAVEILKGVLGGEPRPLVALSAMREPPLSLVASTNNVTAEWTPHGVIELRQRDAGNTLIGHFRTEKAARDYINSIAQKAGPELIGPSDVPPGAVTGGASPPPPGVPADVASGLPPNLPPDPLNVDWLQPGKRIATLADYVASSLPLLVEYDRVINGYDARWGTTFSNGSRALQSALRQMDVARYPWLMRLHNEVDVLLKGKTRDRAAVLSRFAETMSSDQVAKEGFFRPLNDAEINMGNWLASNGIDNAKVLRYTRRVVELERKLQGPPLQKALADLATEYGLDKNHVQAANLFLSVRNVPIQEAYLGHIVRYADAKLLEMQGFDLTPEGFAREHAIEGKELLAMQNLEKLAGEMADNFNIPQYRRIRRWISHYVAQNERGINPATAFLGQKGISDVAEMRFLSDLARTGELSNYVMDPVLAMLRYANAGFRARYLTPVLKGVLEQWKGEIGKVPAGAQRGATRVLSKMLDDVRGIPDASDAFIRRTVDEVLDSFGVSASNDVAKNVVNAINSTWSVKFLAFRVFQGVRDYTTGWMSAYTSFGAERAAKMHARGFGATADQIAALHASGAIPPSMTPISVESPAALLSTETAAQRAFGLGAKAAGKYAEYVNHVAGWGLKGSLQPQVYSRWHAGAYLEAHELAGRVFTQMELGKMTAREGFKELTLDAYAAPFVRELQELVRGKKFQEAAHLYGQETSRMVAVVYGAAAHPKGWNTTFGRALTNYGRFPTWATMRGIEVLSRGSRSYRARALVRFATSQAVMYKALALVGIAGWNWLLLPSIRWLGGPLFSLIQAGQKLLAPSEQDRAEGLNEVGNLLNPTPLVVKDIFDGLRLTNSEDENSPSNPFESAVRISGARLSDNPSLFDYLVGDF